MHSSPPVPFNYIKSSYPFVNLCDEEWKLNKLVKSVLFMLLKTDSLPEFTSSRLMEMDYLLSSPEFFGSPFFAGPGAASSWLRVGLGDREERG